MNTEILNQAKILWDYFLGFCNENETDIIVVCCSYDLRICDYACRLFKKSGAKKIIFSGNSGNWTRDLWDRPEAEIFKERALQCGINESNIIIEDQATNIGENISFSKKHLKSNDRVTFVSKSNTILRIRLTVPKHIDIDADFAAPQFSFPEEVSEVIGIKGLINEMVGDINRIIEYPHSGFQEEHQIPLKIMESYHYLISRGFTEHLLTTVPVTD